MPFCGLGGSSNEYSAGISGGKPVSSNDKRLGLSEERENQLGLSKSRLLGRGELSSVLALQD